jgi:hypothetical protein
MASYGGAWLCIGSVFGLAAQGLRAKEIATKASQAAARVRSKKAKSTRIKGCMKDTERQRELLALWLQRPPEKRTENDLLIFYGDLIETRPHLLHGPGDSYQQLKVDLRGHVEKAK